MKETGDNYIPIDTVSLLENLVRSLENEAAIGVDL